MKGYFGLIFLLLLTHTVTSAQDRYLTVQEAVMLGLEHSKALKVSEAALDEAEAALAEAKHNRYPDLNVSGSYLRMNTPRVDLQVPLGKDGASGPDPSSIHIDQLAYGMANASLPLFAGGRIRAGIRSADYLRKAASLDLRYDQEAVIQNTIAAYYNLYKAQAACRLYRENLKEAQLRVSEFSNLEQNGLLARNDLLKAQLQEANISLVLMDADQNREMANFNINLMLGLPETTVLRLDSTFDLSGNPVPPLAGLEQATLTHRADYLALSEKNKAASSGIKMAKSRYFPSLALTGGYAAIYVPDFITVTNAVNVGLGLQYNLADLFKNGARVKKAEARAQQVFWATQQKHDQVRIELHEAYQDYLRSVKKIAVYQKAIDQANENFRIVKNKYDNALATTRDLLEADVSQLEAHMNFEFAQADAVVAYAKLLAASGQLSERYLSKKQ